MQRMTTEDAAPAGPAGLAAAVYAPAWRVVIAALRVQSRIGLLFVFALLLFPYVELTPFILFRAVAVLAALPGLAAWLLERAFAARVAVGRTLLVVQARGERMEIPRDAVAAAEPWRVPLPRTGLTLRLRSGRRIAVALDDPGALLDRLGMDSGRAYPVVAWAAARAPRAAGGWQRPLVRYPLFGLVPGAILFRTHQWIAYGGTFGQYYLLGLRAYIGTFAVYWATVAVYLVIWGNVWRLVAEAVTLAGTYTAPGRAVSLRRGAERAWTFLYYGGALLILLGRLLP
jgi:apolipoprotein N-acyltransferase